jgi:hypothetical protein
MTGRSLEITWLGVSKIETKSHRRTVVATSVRELHTGRAARLSLGLNGERPARNLTKQAQFNRGWFDRASRFRKVGSSCRASNERSLFMNRMAASRLL